MEEAHKRHPGVQHQKTSYTGKDETCRVLAERKTDSDWNRAPCDDPSRNRIMSVKHLLKQVEIYKLERRPQARAVDQRVCLRLGQRRSLKWMELQKLVLSKRQPLRRTLLLVLQR